MKIIRQQNFNVSFFEFQDDNGFVHRIGLGNWKDEDNGCEMFYPEAGSEYMMVIYDNGWYKFQHSEFVNDIGVEYIAEKLKCSIGEAKTVRKFISEVLSTDALVKLLSGERDSFKNPYMK